MLAYIDVDDTVLQTYGYAKQGAGRGYTGTKGLNVLLGIISTPSSRPLCGVPGAARATPTAPRAPTGSSPTAW